MHISESTQNLFSDSGIDLDTVSESHNFAVSSKSVFLPADNVSYNIEEDTLVLVITSLFFLYNNSTDNYWDDAAGYIQ